MLEMTTHLAEASVLDGVHKQTSDIQQIMLMSEQLSAVQEELMQSRIELSKTVPTHALENVEAAAKHERRRPFLRSNVSSQFLQRSRRN